MNAAQFIQNISQDNAIIAQMNRTGWDTNTLVTFAASRGLSFSVSELQSAMDEAWGMLSEEELANIAGGKHGQGDNSQGNNNNQGNDNSGNSNASSCSFYYGG